MSFLKKLLGLERKKGLATYQRGIQYFNRLEYDKAIDDFEQVLKEKSLANSLETNLAKFYCGRAYINVGITEFAKNRSETALGYFVKALAFNPEDTDLHYFIGICLNNCGKYQDAMASFSKILETEPWNIPTKLKIAIIFHNMKMWENAEDIHRAILKKHPDFADVHYHLGLALMSQGKPEAAADEFSHALSINPNYTEARLKLAMVHICLGHLDKADENLTHIISQHPGYADVHYLMAIVKEKNRNFTDAICHLKTALEISPRFKNAIVKLIIAYCRTGDRPAALAHVDQALSYYPQDGRITSIQKALKVFDPAFEADSTLGNPDAIIDLEDEYLIKELKHEFHKDLDIMPNVAEMIAMFNNSKYTREDSSLTEFLIPFITEQIHRHPTYPDLYNSLGTQLLAVNKLLEAENAFNRALKLNPDYVAARVNLMKTLYRSRKFVEADAHGNYLVAKNLPFPDVYDTLAHTQIHLKRFDDALVNVKRVLRLRPGMNNANLLLAKVYLGLKNKEAALETLKLFLEGPTDPEREQEARQLLEDLRTGQGSLF